ncbi:thioredoxin domain-containing protein [Pseudomonas sp. 148P]|uniref:Thioredoxin domain-containing protein n=1 Tax=Pseudomonas ulcerans TaxID=3115852 RepID=A0ABU7HVS8_9PSED|nr:MULTISPECIES: thioredoxin domain-containing protein [unclassified Pseudomonas]MEE1924497.1 thioredoxin domain-containing protein [Pseudomonas sp. 147P]MEE1935659.1 thioredoxin domain-containing protein [Pseudomonas sp. 148P]
MFDLRIFSVFIIMAIAGAGVIWKFAATPNARSPDETWYFGPANARWVITEYADLECPYCRAYTPQLKHWVSGQENVKLAWHHFPLDIHGVAAQSEARLVQCAGYLGGAAVFWQAIELVLLRTRGDGQGLAEELEVPGVSTEALSSCARASMDIRGVVEGQIAVAKSRGIGATPTIEVTDSLTGHSMRLEGPVDSAALLSVIDALAAQAPLRKD